MNILSEILRGLWFLYSQNIERYSGLASGLLSGKFSVLGRREEQCSEYFVGGGISSWGDFEEE